MRGELNSHDDLGADSDEKGYRVSFSYIDQFLDDTLGLTFGVARLDSPLATQGAGTYEPWHANGTPTDPNPGVVINPGVAADTFITDGIKVRTDMGDEPARRCDGGAAVEAERLVHEHPRPVLHEAQARGQRAQPRSEPGWVSRSVLRWHARAGHLRIFGHHGRGRHRGRRPP